MTSYFGQKNSIPGTSLNVEGTVHKWCQSWKLQAAAASFVVKFNRLKLS